MPRGNLSALGFGLLLTCLHVGAAPPAVAGDLAETPHLRRPAALAIAGERLYVANRRSGTLSAIDLASREVVGEYAVGEQLEDLATLSAGRLLAVDSGANQLLLVARQNNGLSVVARLDVAAAPVSGWSSATRSAAGWRRST